MSDAGFSPEKIMRQIKQQGPAPVHLWNPPFCGDIDMRIARDGSWHYQGSPIQRAAMVRLFSSILRLDEDGCYYLVTPVEKVRIQVDDCPFTAQLLEVSGSGEQQRLQFTLNTGELLNAGAAHPLTVEFPHGPENEPHPILAVRDGLRALVTRNVFYQLAELAQPHNFDGNSALGVWSEGQFFELSKV